MNYEQYKETYNTGCYIREGKDNILLEDLTYDQIQDWTNSLDKQALQRTIHILIQSHHSKDYLIRSLLQHNPILNIPQDIQKELTNNEDN